MIRTDYTFDASAQTITFADPIVEENIGVIANKDRGVLIYNSFDPSAIGTLAGQVLTLTYDTTTHADSDILQIFYGEDSKHVTVDNQTSLTNEALRAADVKVSIDNELVNVVVVDPNTYTDYDDLTPKPIVTVPENYGQQPASLSWPMAMANEHILDLQQPLATFAMPIINTLITFQDCLQFRSCALQIITGPGVSAGILTFEQSNDKTTWIACPTTTPYFPA